MNFLADESIDKIIVERIRTDGLQVWYVAEMKPGIADPEVLAKANEENAVLLTADKDFGELVYRQRLVNAGVVLVRLAGLSPNIKAEIVSKCLFEHGSELADAFSVLSPGSIRIRKRY